MSSKEMKSELSHVEDNGHDLNRQATITALPDTVSAEAGVILDVAGTNISGLKLAKDNHVCVP